MSPESTHKLMGFYMEVLILGVTLVHGFRLLSYRVYRVNSFHAKCLHVYVGFLQDTLYNYGQYVSSTLSTICMDPLDQP